MTKPLTPSEAKKRLGEAIPEGVIEAVNELLLKELRSDSLYATLLIGEVCTAIRAKMQVTKIPDFWLDFEPVFRRAGWKVEYDRPGYNESYEGNWKFSKRRR